MKKVLNVNPLDSLEEFVEVYKNRPIENNSGGMDFNHSFATYLILKIKNPKLVVESGVWKGLSTYIIKSAVPKSEIVCLDVNFKNIQYKVDSANYFETDFSDINWSKFQNINDSVCFFDDHQNSLERLKEMKWWGFTRAIFEDNFPVGEGDAYSLKQIINKTGHPNIQLSKKYKPKKNIEKIIRKYEESVLHKYYFRQNMIKLPNTVDEAGARLNIKDMYEFPPVYTHNTSYWGPKWEGNYNKLEDLINTENINQYPHFLKFFTNNKNHFNYSFITYVELKNR